MKKFFARIHLWLSVPAGLVFSIVALSGALLLFEEELTRLRRAELYRVETAAGAAPLAPSQLAARIRTQLGDTLRLRSLRLPGVPGEPCLATFDGERRRLSVDPCTGEVKGWLESPALFRTARQLHRWLLDPPPAKGAPSFGKRVVGIVTLASVVILTSGLVLWIPRTRRALKSRLGIACRKGARRFWYDLHVSAGFYASLLLLLMALTGLTWSFGWYRTAAYALFGGPQQSRAAPAQREAEPRSAEYEADPALWDLAREELRGRYPLCRSITFEGRTARIEPDPAARMRRTDTARFDDEGRIVSLVTHDEAPRSQRLRGWFYALHTGTWGGIWSKTLYLLAALVGGTLPLTGYYLWLRRLRARRAARAGVRARTKRQDRGAGA